MSKKKKEKEYNFIYKTTNVLTGKFYIGMHSTDNLDDGYIGSGTQLKRSIKIHGLKKFKFEILEFLPNRKLLIEREREIVNEDVVSNKLCINLKVGGEGGFVNDEHKKKFRVAGKRALKIKRKKDSK